LSAVEQTVWHYIPQDCNLIYHHAEHRYYKNY